MRNITVDFLDTLPLSKQRVELVERKGIGHPDSICDGIAEAVSRGLCKEYLKRFDVILHHNTDQVELVGGESNPVFGGGELIRPIYILLSGRATTYVDDQKIPVGKIALDAARNYIKEFIGEVDLDSDIVLDPRLGQGSTDLRGVFDRDGMPKSNDTSFGVSFAPFTLTEELTYKVGKYINFDLGMREVFNDVLDNSESMDWSPNDRRRVFSETLGLLEEESIRLYEHLRKEAWDGARDTYNEVVSESEEQDWDRFLGEDIASQKRRSEFARLLGYSGGDMSVPDRVYERLEKEAKQIKIGWSQVHEALEDIQTRDGSVPGFKVFTVYADVWSLFSRSTAPLNDMDRYEIITNLINGNMETFEEPELTNEDVNRVFDGLGIIGEKYLNLNGTHTEHPEKNLEKKRDLVNFFGAILEHSKGKTE